MPQTPFTSPRRLYTDDAKQLILEEGDPRAAYLLVNEGCMHDPAIFPDLDVEGYIAEHSSEADAVGEQLPDTTAPQKPKRSRKSEAAPAETSGEPDPESSTGTATEPQS